MNDMTDGLDTAQRTLLAAPDTEVDAREVFGLDIDWKIPAFSKADARVPDIDDSYVFDPDTTLAILAGFAHDRRVMVQGYHGTGKSTHIEQVAARLNWPCIRINLDAHISRIDLVGRDAIVLRDGLQVVHQGGHDSYAQFLPLISREDGNIHQSMSHCWPHETMESNMSAFSMRI